jgi:hypothetical protein
MRESKTKTMLSQPRANVVSLALPRGLASGRIDSER